MLTALSIAIGLVAWVVFVKLLLAAMGHAREEEEAADRIIDDVGLPMRAGIRERRSAE